MMFGRKERISPQPNELQQRQARDERMTKGTLEFLSKHPDRAVCVGNAAAFITKPGGAESEAEIVPDPEESKRMGPHVSDMVRDGFLELVPPSEADRATWRRQVDALAAETVPGRDGPEPWYNNAEQLRDVNAIGVVSLEIGGRHVSMNVKRYRISAKGLAAARN